MNRLRKIVAHWRRFGTLLNPDNPPTMRSMLWESYAFSSPGGWRGILEMIRWFPTDVHCWFLYRICGSAFLDHDLQDHGQAGPDSGYMEVSCDRCEYSYGRKYLY